MSPKAHVLRKAYFISEVNVAIGNGSSFGVNCIVQMALL